MSVRFHQSMLLSRCRDLANLLLFSRMKPPTTFIVHHVAMKKLSFFSTAMPLIMRYKSIWPTSAALPVTPRPAPTISRTRWGFFQSDGSKYLSSHIINHNGSTESGSTILATTVEDSTVITAPGTRSFCRSAPLLGTAQSYRRAIPQWCPQYHPSLGVAHPHHKPRRMERATCCGRTANPFPQTPFDGHSEQDAT